MKKTIVFGILIISIFCNWQIKRKSILKKVEWLIGTWENKTKKGSIYETWTKKNDFTFSGTSYIIKEKDTIVFETIQLVEDKNNLFYIPSVKNQNNNEPVRFALKTISKTKLIFENQKHDFPQIISYTKNSDDTLVAEISGKKNGQKQKQIFAMTRLKN